LRLGTPLWIGQDFLYLAETLKLWDPQQLQRFDYPSNVEIVRAYRNQQIDVAAFTSVEAIEVMDTHLNTQVFLINDFSNGNDVIFGQPAIQSLAALKGRKVGLEATTFEYYILARGLSFAGLTPNDVTLVPLAAEEQEAAFRQGQIDGLVTYDPVRTKLLNSEARLLFDSRKIPGEIADVLITSTTVMQQRSETLQQLVNAWFSAIAQFQSQPQSVAKPMADRQHLTPEALISGLKLLHIPDRRENQKLLSGADSTLSNSLQKLQEVMLQKKLLRRPVDLAQLLTDQYVR
jgi:NitT/TauT family transport system substrate-binding protein